MSSDPNSKAYKAGEVLGLIFCYALVIGFAVVVIALAVKFAINILY